MPEERDDAFPPEGRNCRGQRTEPYSLPQGSVGISEALDEDFGSDRIARTWVPEVRPQERGLAMNSSIPL